MLTTGQARTEWGPPCQGARSTVALFGTGKVSVRTEIVAPVDALDRCLRAFAYRTHADDTGAYNCRKITGGTGYSLHAYGIALDINWQSNPYGPVLKTDMPQGMVAAIKAIRTRNGKQVWRWGGDYSGNKDAMHFEVVCTKADLATGIDPSTVPGATQEDDMTPEQDALLRGLNEKVGWLLASAEREGKLEAEEIARLKEIQQTQEREISKAGG